MLPNIFLQDVCLHNVALILTCHSLFVVQETGLSKVSTLLLFSSLVNLSRYVMVICIVINSDYLPLTTLLLIVKQNASNIDRERERPLFIAAAAARADSASMNGAAAMAAASSPIASGAPGPAGAGSSQNEVLANFFQSLLTKKNSSGPIAGTPTSPTTGAPQPVASSATLPPFAGNHLGGAGENPSSRREVRKELDKLRSSTGSKG